MRFSIQYNNLNLLLFDLYLQLLLHIIITIIIITIIIIIIIIKNRFLLGHFLGVFLKLCLARGPGFG